MGTKALIPVKRAFFSMPLDGTKQSTPLWGVSTIEILSKVLKRIPIVGATMFLSKILYKLLLNQWLEEPFHQFVDGSLIVHRWGAAKQLEFGGVED
ncbi:MAG: hypothetical protein GY799_03655 [Desulfobulbaceae bacterium]|nr:hypothetical protein [Desulfobulbaceae bacterium]